MDALTVDVTTALLHRAGEVVLQHTLTWLRQTLQSRTSAFHKDQHMNPLPTTGVSLRLELSLEEVT